MADVCRVCGSRSLSLLYESPGEWSFTSTQSPLPRKVHVEFCSGCGHAQTPPLEDIDEYYDTTYNYRNRDVDEDDIYSVDAGGIVYRAEHQARVLEQKLDLSMPLRILDFGCGKAASLRNVVERHPNITPYVFDVSEAYVSAWDQFVPSQNQASYQAPDSWNGQLDIVLSLFSLEHVEDPRRFARTLRALLRPTGRMHVIVPNLYRNASDLLVADHVNHFSTASLRRLFHDAGFGNIEIDADSHRAALLVSATVSREKSEAEKGSEEEFADVEGRARAIAAEWTASAATIRYFESEKRQMKSAIYGSGVYGLFIATTLSSLENVAYFMDANPYRQGLTLLGRTVIAPEAIGDDVEAVLVGLNPKDARHIIQECASLHSIKRDFVYL